MNMRDFMYIVMYSAPAVIFTHRKENHVLVETLENKFYFSDDD